MPRFSPLLLKKPDSQEGTITVSDPLQPDMQSLTFTLRARSDALWRNERINRVIEYSALYATGDAEYIESGGKTGEGPAALLSPEDNATIPVSESLCSVIATLSLMEETALIAKYGSLEAIPLTSDDKPMTFLEWAILGERAGNAFEKLANEAQKILNRAEGRETKKAKKATVKDSATSTPSAPLSATDTAVTP